MDDSGDASGYEGMKQLLACIPGPTLFSAA
jgi:hypothetical protein